ncbi:hypothetical protein VP1G_10761 [Cytospora mali]|uniref:Uncharacterized protein n=1 Tax=Cytospora mali TaxID=578113 RepID=A0A194UWV7_CYTMA|nr:hypothetical protein VP1G_10761 [Valsa mali var. pyri (nom. inval.)]
MPLTPLGIGESPRSAIKSEVPGPACQPECVSDISKDYNNETGLRKVATGGGRVDLDMAWQALAGWIAKTKSGRNVAEYRRFRFITRICRNTLYCTEGETDGALEISETILAWPVGAGDAPATDSNDGVPCLSSACDVATSSPPAGSSDLYAGLTSPCIAESPGSSDLKPA